MTDHPRHCRIFGCNLYGYLPSIDLWVARAEEEKRRMGSTYSEAGFHPRRQCACGHWLTPAIEPPASMDELAALVTTGDIEILSSEDLADGTTRLRICDSRDGEKIYEMVI